MGVTPVSGTDRSTRTAWSWTARLLAALITVVGVGLVPALSAVAAESGVLGDATPRIIADPDTVPVELGMRFSSSAAGSVTGIRFYKSTTNTGTHVGTLWDSRGTRLASVTFSGETASGWQKAYFAQPVTIARGTTYVVSYLAPRGHYSADNGYFAAPVTRSPLTVPTGGGVYSYTPGVLPAQNHENSNYWVDVVFAASADTPSTSVPVSSGVGTAICVLADGTACDAPDEAETPSTPTTPSTPSVPSVPTQTGSLSLPRIAWEGADYWKQFAKTDRAGWDEPTFFPIAVWWSVASSSAEVAFDRSLGLNTYVVTNPTADYRLMENGGMYWVGGQLPNITQQSPNWVGSFLDDEVDGRFEPAAGFAELQRLADAVKPADTGRFRYANYTSSLLTIDRADSVRNQYTNAYTDAVSVDQYFYGVAQCDWAASSLRWSTPAGSNPIVPANCRTSSSYGKIVDNLREADAKDGRLQSIWQFVEVVGDEHRLDGDKAQGQVMNSVIHGARAIVWFPQSFYGGCETGNAFRTYEYSKSACLAGQVEGAKKVNLFVQSLAPVINTQSYVWNFGSGIDSMLKTYDGSAYVFAMTKDGGSGSRTFTLPAGVAGTSVEVVGEGRSIPVSGGTFTDSFAKESSYHVYRVSLK